MRGSGGLGPPQVCIKAYVHPCRARGDLVGKVKGWGLLELAEKASCNNSCFLRVKGVSGPKIHSIVGVRGGVGLGPPWARVKCTCIHATIHSVGGSRKWWLAAGVAVTFISTGIHLHHALRGVNISILHGQQQHIFADAGMVLRPKFAVSGLGSKGCGFRVYSHKKLQKENAANNSPYQPYQPLGACSCPLTRNPDNFIPRPFPNCLNP